MNSKIVKQDYRNNLPYSVLLCIFCEWRVGMNSWKTDFFKGKNCIISKDLKGALEYLHRSIKNCPVENDIELADLFFYLGVAFKKLGCIFPAVRSLDASMCADKGGQAAVLLRDILPGERLTTDRSYFYLIQFSAYLSRKKSGKIDSEAEKDMIIDLISMYWEEVVDSGILQGQCQSEKILIFKDIVINFPYVEVNTDFPFSDYNNTGQIIPFKTKVKSD